MLGLKRALLPGGMHNILTPPKGVAAIDIMTATEWETTIYGLKIATAEHQFSGELSVNVPEYEPVVEVGSTSFAAREFAESCCIRL